MAGGLVALAGRPGDALVAGSGRAQDRPSPAAVLAQPRRDPVLRGRRPDDDPMTEQEARELEQYWGAPGPAPGPDWRLCYRCGEWWPRNPRFWCMPHRLCRACKNGERVGVWPYTRRWHRV